ncbi:MAG: hypothetical protein HOC71_05445, partial [Candidatus Latescibacteria bacterium]|nr:hypothetical protein [Candidatus Latescibacterota bacterium]
MEKVFYKTSVFKGMALILGAFFLIRVWLACSLNLTQDEAYYWMWSRNIDWCYYDHPGMIAWLEYAGT